MADFGSNGMNTQANVNNVNSNTIALFSAEGHMLRVSFKNDITMLTIIPKVIGEDGRPRWPKDMGRTAFIRPQAAAALFQQTSAEMVPCIVKGEAYPGYITVPTNRDKTALVGFGYNGSRVTFNIFNNVGNDRRCNDYASFIFDVVPVISQYDPTSGHYVIAESQGQFQVILQSLWMAAQHMSGVVAHTDKVSGYFNTNQIIAYLRALATKFGVTPGQYGNFGGVRDDGSSYQIYGNGQTSGGSGTTTPWATGESNMAELGQKLTTDVQQLSSLEGLMGSEIDLNPMTGALQTA